MTSKPKILIVDDDKFLRKTLSDILRAKGFDPVPESTGTLALAQVEQAAPAVALIDLQLDDMSGIELMAQIKAQATPTECIILTGHASQKSAIEAINLGAYSYLQKPYDMDQLLLIIQRAVEKHDAARLLEQRAAQLLLINDIGRQLTAELDLEAVLNRSVQLLHQKFGYHHVTIFTLDDAGQIIEMQARAGLYLDYFPEHHRIKLGEGMNGWVAQNGQRLLANDVTAEPRYVNFFPGVIPTRSELSVPISVGGKLVGVLDVQSPDKNAFTENDVIAIETIANQIAVATENARLYQVAQQELAERARAEEEVRRRNRELALLNRVISVSAAEMEPELFLETVCRELAQAFALPHASARLLNPQKTEAVVVAEYCTDNRLCVSGRRLPVAGSPTLRFLLQQSTPMVVSNAATDTRLVKSKGAPNRTRAQAYLSLPLVIKGDVIGSLELESAEPRTFNREEVNLAWSVADEVAGMFARVRLLQTQRRLIAAIEQSAESVLITDTAGTIIYVNPAFEQISGYSQKEALGQNPRILKSGRQNDAFYANMWKTITGGHVWQGRIINKKKDGRFYTEDATISPVRNNDGSIVNFVAVKRDISRELELEEQYYQAQKMEAIGRLTGGIAHDFNNMLTAITGFAELAQMRTPEDDPRHDLIGNVVRSGQRAANLVGQLMAFSRKQIIEPEKLDVNEVVTELDKMLRRIIGENIDLATVLTPNLGIIKADRGQLGQVLVNLVVNARDAMPNGGKLTIETHNVELDDTVLATHVAAQAGPHVLLTITDTGTGMTGDVLQHIFEPFFTTKETGQGTGLGLATVYGIVKQNKGNIRVYSEPGLGTTFRIYLPVVESAPSAHRADTADDQIPVGSETILLVEDDPGVRDLAETVLQQFGYNLLKAENGSQALQIAAEHKNDIHLLLTDVVMPGINGKEVARQIVELNPETRVLFMSGYTDETISSFGVLDAGAAFIQKPLSPAALARKVRRVLDNELRP